MLLSKMSNTKKQIIAITGNVGCGKSSVTNILKRYNYEILSCDDIIYELKCINNKGYNKIVDTFSKDILNKDLTINNKVLSNIIYSDIIKKEQLESILLPLLFDELLIRINNIEDDIIFVEVPTLYESGWDEYFNDIWLIVSSIDECRNRLIKYRNLNLEQIKLIESNQISIEDKIKLDNTKIYNDKDLLSLEKQIINILRRE